MPDNGLKEYRVAVYYEEGFTVRVIANNKDHAKKIAFNRVEDQGNDCDGYLKAVHRDYGVTDVEEI
jgi:hypothetical protein